MLHNYSSTFVKISCISMYILSKNDIFNTLINSLRNYLHIFVMSIKAGGHESNASATKKMYGLNHFVY